MRIIGGRLKGRRLATFKGSSIRPTSDKVREAVFNILPREFPFKRVLDLFAGTGAMGIEALSRGAVEAVFVDSGAEAASIIRKNLETCGIAARVFKSEVFASIRQLSRKGDSFDLIIIDPPYAAGVLEEAVRDISKGGLLAPGGVIVAESSKRAPLEGEFPGLEVYDERRYGDTAVYFLRHPETIDA